MSDHHIIVDSREKIHHPKNLLHLSKTFGDEVSVKTLRFGDYVFTGFGGIRIAIELCTVTDLLGKIDSGRLAFQLTNCLQTYDRTILMVESVPQVDAKGNLRVYRAGVAFPWSRVGSILHAAQAHGVIVHYAAGSEFVAGEIAQRIRWWRKDPSTHKYFRLQEDLGSQTFIPTGGKLDDRLRMLMAIPDIGEETARAAIEMFGSIRNIAMLTPAALQTIPGWGPVTSQKVYDYFGGSNGEGK